MASHRLSSIVSHLQPAASDADASQSISRQANAGAATASPNITSASTPSTDTWTINPALKPLPSHLTLRSLQLNDYHKQFIQVLSQLTKAPDVSLEVFTRQFNLQRQCPNTYHTVVIEDTQKQLIIGTATLLVEYKYIRGGSVIGHIEDVVVNSSYRGLQLGQHIVCAMIARGKSLGCYKIILDCETHNIPFYEKLNFKVNANHMALYL